MVDTSLLDRARPLKVLVWYWGRRGAGPVYTREIMQTLAAQSGLKVSGSIAFGNDARAATQALGLPLDCVQTYQDQASFISSIPRIPAVRRNFARFMRQEKFDVVLSTMPHLWTPLMVDCVTAAGAAYVPVLHDACPHPGERQPLWAWRRQRELRHATRVICLSTSVANGVAHHDAYPRDRIDVIPYGVPEMPGLLPLPRRWPQDRAFRFMFFGRIMPYKGVDLLLEAKALLDATAAVPSELWIVGAGDWEPYRARAEGLKGMTVINRWIDEAEIAALLNQADAIVLPYREASQSGVTSQAYAAGLPVVATPIGGLQEQVNDGINGILAATANPAAFAEAMQRLLDPTFYDALAARVPDDGLRLSFMAQGADYAAILRRATHAAISRIV